MDQTNINTMVGDQNTKVWNYSEQTNKHTTYHTIIVTKQRFTHEAQIKDAGKAMRRRTDLSLKEVNSVSTYYGLSKNLIATILVAILAVLFVGIAIALLANEAPAVVGVIFIVLALVLAVVAYFIYKKVKPTFTLEIETIIRNGLLKQTTLSYGNNTTATIEKKKPSLIACLFMIVIFPIGIAYLLSRNNKGGKYKFMMDPAVGNDIVDTLGSFLMDD